MNWPKLVVLWTDAAVWALVLAVGVYVVAVLRRPDRAATWQRVFRSAPALASAWCWCWRWA
jgi:peptide/nickel transport system permease protein